MLGGPKPAELVICVVLGVRVARKRGGFVAAMATGVVLIGAATFGVSEAKSHHDDVAAAQDAAVAASLEAQAEASDPVAASSGAQSPVAASQPPAPNSTNEQPSASAPAAFPLSPGSASTAPVSGPVSAGSGNAPTASPPSGSSTSTRPPAPVTMAHTTTAPATMTAAATTTAPPVAQKYRDGQFSATGSYNSPGGQESLTVTMTLREDRIVKSSLQLGPDLGVSHSYQTLFAQGYLPKVIGKDIDSVKLSVVSGSSLTSMGFNEALQKIESQAHGASS